MHGFLVFSTFTFVLFKILFMFGSLELQKSVTTWKNFQKELSENLGCVFAAFLLLSSTWTSAATLPLGSRPRQGLTKVRAKNEA
jgi:hypothetical protein